MPSLSSEEKRRLIGLPKQSSKSNIGPWVAEIAQRVPDTRAGDALDDAFIATIEKVERLVTDMSKQLKIRVEAWVKKLCQVHVNEVFLRNRNVHAELLLSCCLSENWTEPFNRMPAEGPLASLPQHVTCMIKQRHLEHRLECAKEQSRRATGSMQAIPVRAEDDAPPDAWDQFSPVRKLDESVDDLRLSGTFDLANVSNQISKPISFVNTPAKGVRKLDAGDQHDIKLPNKLYGGQSAASTPAVRRSIPERGNSPQAERKSLNDRDIIERNKFEWTDRELKKVVLDNKRLRASVRAYREANTQLSAQVITLKEENAALRQKQALQAFEGVREGRGSRFHRRQSQSRSPSAGAFRRPIEYDEQERGRIVEREREFDSRREYDHFETEREDRERQRERARSKSVDSLNALRESYGKPPTSQPPAIPNPDFPEPPPRAQHSQQEDPEVFLNYLSRFQAYTTNLLSDSQHVSPRRPKPIRSSSPAAMHGLTAQPAELPYVAASPAKSIASNASRLFQMIEGGLDHLAKTSRPPSPSPPPMSSIFTQN